MSLAALISWRDNEMVPEISLPSLTSFLSSPPSTGTEVAAGEGAGAGARAASRLASTAFLREAEKEVVPTEAQDQLDADAAEDYQQQRKQINKAIKKEI